MTPDVEMTIGILLNLKGNFEKHYKIKISKEMCVKICRLTDRYIRNRNNPDKSILAMDLACAHAISAASPMRWTLTRSRRRSPPRPASIRQP